MMPVRHAPTVDSLTRANTLGSIVFAVVFGGFTVFVICVAWLVSFFVEAPIEVFRWFVLVAAGLGVLSVGSIIALGVWNWRDVIQAGIDWANAEITHKFPAPQPAPTLPEPAPLPPARIIPITNGERVGDVVPEPDLIHGFDPRDLEWLCKYLANGNEFTERRMSTMPLPFTGDKFDKAEPGTPYYRLFNASDGLFVRAAIITGRGGVANRMGELAVKDAGEMMDKLRGL